MIKNGLRMVRGNAFSLRIKVRAYRIDGTEIGDFVLNPLTDTLLLTSSSTVRPLAFSVEDGSTNNAVVSFGAAMQAGYYGLDFSGVWDGVAWRFSAKNVFQIVELTAQGNVPKDGVIYDDTYDTHAEVTLTSQSVQSDWAQNDPTNPSFIRNKPEIYTKAEINVLLDNIYTKSEVDGLISDEEERAKAAEKANADDIDGIEEKIPSGASSQNKLVDQQTMNSSIATATATYRGAYNLVSDLELTVAATEQQIAAALATKMTELSITPDNNDYCYVQVPTSDATPTQIARVDRYKYNGTAWGFEYSLNNSGFTAAQWAALNSGITSGLVAKLGDLPTNSELTILLGGKEDKSNKVTSLSEESTDTQYPSAKCVYDLHKANADDIDGIEEKIPSGASSQNKLVDQQTMNSSIGTATATFRGAYNLVSDLSLTVEATHADIEAALALKMTELSITPDNNDYAFVQVPTSDETPTLIERVERYKFNGTVWLFEYALNNSGFTSEQWAALNSGITSGLVTKLSDLPTYTELMTLLGGKQDTINDLSDIRSGAAKGETAYQKPVGGIPSEDMSSGVQSSLQKAEDAAPQSTTYNKTEVDGMIGGIEEKIPSGASSQNKLVDQQTMNSSIATATATYRGAYNLVSDLELTVAATEQQIAAALATKMTALSITPDNNDYCYVQVPTSDATPTEIARVDRYKYNGTAWGFEYALNNSGFTAAQWAALNSGITSGLVTKLSDLPTNSELTTLLAGKQDVISDLSDIRSGAAKGETAYQKPVGGIPSEDMSSGVQSSLQKAENAAPQSTTYNKTEVDGMIGGIEEKIPSGASSQNKLVDQQTMNSSIATATATYRGAYNLVSDLSLTIAATEQQIAAALATVMAAATPPIVPDNNDYCYVQVPTSDATPTQIARVDRYKYNGAAWEFEYSLNNSGFTAAQWAALNSGITSGLVTKLSDLPAYTDLMTLLNGKQNVLSFDNTPTVNSNNPVTSGGIKSYVDTKDSELSTQVNSQLNTQDTTINTRMAAQDAAIAQLNGNDVIIGALPATGVANKIYRVPNDPSAGKYTDYMFNADALTTPIKIGGPYDFPGIDKMPIENSDNVVESGGLYDYLEGWDKVDLTGSVTWTTGYALGLNGAATVMADGALSDFIPVTAGDVYLFNTYGLNDNTGILPVMGYSSDSESAAVVKALPFGSMIRFQETLFCLVIPSGITHIRIVTRYASGSIYSGFYFRRYREITNAITRNMYIKPMLNPEGWLRIIETGSDGIKRFSISKTGTAKYICQPCQPGDRFTMKSTWHTQAVLAFYDADLNLLTAERKTSPYTGVVTAPESAAWVTSMLNTGNGDYMMKGADPMAGLCMKVCTQAEYDAMASHDSNTLYIIT